MTETRIDGIPSREKCEELMVQHSMLPNIVEHSIRVMEVSIAIADNLKSGMTLNRDLVIAAALLHDITKTRSLSTKEHHDASGGELLKELGFLSIAEIVEQHVVIKDLNLQGRLEEREIVFYADKRVLHNVVVTLEERMRDLIERYGKTMETRNGIWQSKVQALAIERKIAGFLSLDLDCAIRANVSRVR